MANQRFIATFAGTLDSKGRVCIPALWRQVLAAQPTPTVYLSPSLDEDSLIGFGEELMESELERLKGHDPLFSGRYNYLAAPLVSGATPLPVDENGRVRLPEEMIAAAGLKDKVVFVGVGAKFEIWNPETYAPVRAQRLADARAERAVIIAQENAARAATQAAALQATAASAPAAPTPAAPTDEAGTP